MKGQNWKTDSQKEIFDKCREYERQTRSDYWRCLRISLFEKIAILFLLHSPCLARMLMKWKR